MSIFDEKKSADKQEFMRAVNNPEHNLPTDSSIFLKDKRGPLIEKLLEDMGSQITLSEVERVIEKINRGDYKEELEGWDDRQKNLLKDYLKKL